MATREVVVRGTSLAKLQRESALAVTVIETERAQRESADLGELLARTQGVGVQRAGGLGSDSRISLNGLDDEQIRFFVDGIPIELMGYPFGFENAPVNFVERVHVYQGVVPIRLGADALGGAMEIVTDRSVTAARAAASLQAGSFGTVRATLGARHLDASTGWFASAESFTDSTDNDYYVEVDVPDAQGIYSKVRVPRFHDAYSARGGNVEVGLVRRNWARRLLLRGFFTEFDKELPHNVLMTVPYGDVRYGGASAGGSLRYEHAPSPANQISAVLGYARNRWDYLDVGDCVYDWVGRCASERRAPGERGPARDQSLWDDTLYARIQSDWRFSPEHAVRVALAPTFFTRSGEDRRTLPGARDLLQVQRDLLNAVDAIEYELDLFEGRLENLLFLKWYREAMQAEVSLPGNRIERLSRSTSDLGYGNALRFRLTPFLYAKASYEWALNLPRPDQVFGNGAQIAENLGLEPERSHNGNLSLSLDLPETPAGAFEAHASVFLRDVEQLIVLLGSDLVFSYQNVFNARVTGAEGSALWVSPGEHVELGGNVTYVDMRNTSSEGTFGAFEGDRIPNRPYLSANGSLRLRQRDVSASGDELSVVWYARYVHEFFRSWASFGGAHPEKMTIASQLTHAAALTYLIEGEPLVLS
ncbi:MAG TPA: TonB-dependent receptor plug domain-containing protein, partial [Polyangiaceae bacterium]